MIDHSARQRADINWATTALSLQETPTHAQLVEILNGITRLIAERKFILLGATLERLLKDQTLRLDVMIAALRGSFPAKSKISDVWHELLSIARRRVIVAGRNPDSLLRGL